MSGNVSIRVICLQYKVYILILSRRSVFVAKTVLCLLMCVQVIPCMMTVIRTDDNAFRDFLFQQLGFLIGIVIAQQGAVQLRQFGAEVFTINLIGRLTFRELGILMTAIKIIYNNRKAKQ